MSKQVTLMRDVRVFQLIEETNRLVRNGDDPLTKGDIVRLGDFEVLFYDHRSQVAMPIMHGCHIEGWVLFEELDMPGLLN